VINFTSARAIIPNRSKVMLHLSWSPPDPTRKRIYAGCGPCGGCHVTQERMQISLTTTKGVSNSFSCLPSRQIELLDYRTSKASATLKMHDTW